MRIVYGDLLSTPEDTNHVGKVYRVYDGAGVATTTAFDFKGNALEEERQLVDDKTTQPDWTDLLATSGPGRQPEGPYTPIYRVVSF